MTLPTFSDDILLVDRHFEAECPPANTALSVPINCTPCVTDFRAIGKAVTDLVHQPIMAYAKRGGRDGFPEVFLAPEDGYSPLDASELDSIKAELRRVLDGNILPENIYALEVALPMMMGGYVDEARLEELIRPKGRALSLSPLSTTQRRVSEAMASVLGTDKAAMSPTTDFFEIGGDSLRAGKLLAMLRKDFNLRLPVGDLFNHSQIEQLSSLIDERLGSSSEATLTPAKDEKAQQAFLPGCKRTCSSTNKMLMLMQLIPMCVVYPMKRALTWTIWMYMLTASQHWTTNNSMPGRLFNLILSLGIARAITSVVCPILAILCKWFIIGTHEEGMYAMWNSYHTRWWLTHKIVTVSGVGIFRHFNWSRVLYYRLLGATIGKNVTISAHATLGEWDLLELGDGTNLDGCICRPFAGERNTSMYLGRITLGKNCHVGMKSIVAAGATIPDDTCIGPNSSSWEINDSTEDIRNLSTSKITGPHWLFTPLIVLVQLLVKFVGALPWMLGLLGLVRQDVANFAGQGLMGDDVVMILRWFTTPRRLAFHYLAVVLNATVGPIFLFAIVLLIKAILDVTIGKSVPGPAHRQSQMQKLRKAIMNGIMSNGRLHDLTELFGQHYEITSIAVRLLGGKVGSRVYWPGTGPTIGDYDLIDIGDDVVFGSRAHLITSDGNGSEVIRVGNNAMVADRVILLPGVQLGDRCTMGSGAMTTRGTSYASDTTWVGSKGGEAVCLSQGPQGQTSSKVTLSASSSLLSPKEKNSFLNLPRTYSTTSSPNEDVEKYASGVTTAVNTAYASTDNLPNTSIFSQPSPKKSFTSRTRRQSSLTLSPSDKEPKTTQTTITALSSTPSTADLNSPTTPTAPSTASPFGRAFYEKLAPYYVFPLSLIALYSVFTTAFTAFYWNVATTSAVQAVAAILDNREFFATATPYRPVLIFAAITVAIAAINTAQAVVALAAVIGAKWALLGRRQQGSYDWDQSSYCQRWQLFLTLEKLRRHCFGGHGVLGLLTGTHYSVIYFRLLGAKIGKDCALFAGGLPSLMFTEPDLLELGDRVVVDDASLVAHINTRGHFTLNELKVGEGSVLRSGSRLLSGACMERETCLLEHTLVMAGDVVDEGCTMQGWPADGFVKERVVL